MILDIDQQRRRISLGMKQCRENPWEGFAARCKKGDRVAGVIKSITDFGIFIGLDGGIDGLVHLSDLSWDEPGEEAVKQYGKGQEVEAVVLSVDSDRERIALGIKQASSDPFANYADINPKGAQVQGKVISCDERQAIIELAEGVEGTLKVSEVSRDRVDNLPSLYPAGTQVDAIIISLDRRNRSVNLSVKQLTEQAEKDAIKAVKEQAPVEAAGPTTIGELIKAQMKKIADKVRCLKVVHALVSAER